MILILDGKSEELICNDYIKVVVENVQDYIEQKLKFVRLMRFKLSKLLVLCLLRVGVIFIK